MSKEVKNKIEDALFNFYLDASKETITESLKSDISDEKEYAKKKAKLLFLTKATANKIHNEHLLKLVDAFQKAIQLNIERPVAILKQLVQSHGSLALYRNLDKLSKEDIIEIIKDKNLIELLEQLDQNEKGH